MSHTIQLADYFPDSQETQISVDAAEIDHAPTEPRYDPAPKQPSSEAGRARGAARAKQRGLGFDGLVLKETIIRKLHIAGHPALAEPLERCHTQQVIKLCSGCRAKSVYYNRCENFYCPCCAGRLARDRRKSVEWWATNISQPKHVVLTARNSEVITRKHLDHFKKAFAKLRRTTFCTESTSRPELDANGQPTGRQQWSRPWLGGFYSIEVTNEGRGWHLHLHALVNSRFIDSVKLAEIWARCLGQDFSIVKVKDARDTEYLREVCKYVVKGDQMASWTPEDIAAYVVAFKGARTFGVFGALYKLRAEHADWFKQQQADAGVCPCGCAEFRIFSEAEWEWFEVVNGSPDDGFVDHRPRAPKPTPEPFLL